MTQQEEADFIITSGISSDCCENTYCPLCFSHHSCIAINIKLVSVVHVGIYSLPLQQMAKIIKRLATKGYFCLQVIFMGVCNLIDDILKYLIFLCCRQQYQAPPRQRARGIRTTPQTLPLTSQRTSTTITSHNGCNISFHNTSLKPERWEN